MDCKKVKNLISDYLDERLSAKDKKSFEEHISGCKKCEDELNSFLDSWKIMANYDTPEVGSDFTAKVVHRVHSLKEQQTSLSLWEKFCMAFSLQKVPVVPAFVSILILAGIAMALMKGHPTGMIDSPEIRNGEKAEIVRNLKDEEIIKNLEIYENADLLENLDLLVDLEAVENLEEESK
jgi:anti-sigma factor RsiW